MSVIFCFFRYFVFSFLFLAIFGVFCCCLVRNWETWPTIGMCPFLLLLWYACVCCCFVVFSVLVVLLVQPVVLWIELWTRHVRVYTCFWKSEGDVKINEEMPGRYGLVCLFFNYFPENKRKNVASCCWHLIPYTMLHLSTIIFVLLWVRKRVFPSPNICKVW